MSTISAKKLFFILRGPRRRRLRGHIITVLVPIKAHTTTQPRWKPSQSALLTALPRGEAGSTRRRIITMLAVIKQQISSAICRHLWPGARLEGCSRNITFGQTKSVSQSCGEKIIRGSKSTFWTGSTRRRIITMLAVIKQQISSAICRHLWPGARLEGYSRNITFRQTKSVSQSIGKNMFRGLEIIF